MEENHVMLIEEAMEKLNEIEASFRTIWPDDKPAPARSDKEFWLYNWLSSGMVHLNDLRSDLDALFDI